MSKPSTLARVANRVALSSCLVSLCLLAAAPSIFAQAQPAQRPEATPAPAASPAPAANARDDHDLSITANVTARELRFEVVPTSKVEFPGQPRRDTVWEAERTNLPQQVQPGVTYRDIGIRLKITSVFADIERIVSEALGETPASDDAPPKTDSNENVQLNSQLDSDANARPATGDARTTSGDARTTSEAARTTSGDARTTSGDARTTSEAAQPGDPAASILPAQSPPAGSSTQSSPASASPPITMRAGRAVSRGSGGVRARRGRL